MSNEPAQQATSRRASSTATAQQPETATAPQAPETASTDQAPKPSAHDDVDAAEASGAATPEEVAALAPAATVRRFKHRDTGAVREYAGRPPLGVVRSRLWVEVTDAEPTPDETAASA